MSSIIGSQETDADAPFEGAGETSFRKARFARVFVLSFGVSLGLLALLGVLPQGFSNAYGGLYRSISSLFVSEESSIIAALPSPDLQGGDGDQGSASGSSAGPAASASTGSGYSAPEATPPPAPSDRALPRMVIVPAAGIEASVVTPSATDVATLDEALLSGAVYYPGSGLPGEKSNLLFFGHSSNLPVVYNQAFKAFNDLERVRLGDEVIVRTGDREYLYRVSAVRLTEASEELITFGSERRMLTLSTCNTFGGKSERFVVEAVLEGSTPLPGALY